MKKLENYCSIIFLFLLATTQVKAQSVDVVIRENGTERKESIDLPKYDLPARQSAERLES